MTSSIIGTSYGITEASDGTNADEIHKILDLDDSVGRERPDRHHQGPGLRRHRRDAPSAASIQYCVSVTLRRHGAAKMVRVYDMSKDLPEEYLLAYARMVIWLGRLEVAVKLAIKNLAVSL